ncbi:MAG: acyl-CoA thioesterase [Spirochaetes bacterium]|nr:acyl-CoA thioesterase [Spirochaetota bacterium]
MNITPYFHIVNYWETDQMGVVHHSNYIKWLEEARCHFLREIGYPYKWIEENGYMLPVYEIKIKYKNSARFEDKISIITNIDLLNEFKMVLSYKIFNEKLLLCEAITIHPWTDRNLKLKKLEKTLLETLKRYENLKEKR